MDTAPVDTTDHSLGWPLGVLLRGYEAVVGTELDGLPHRHRGYQVMQEVVHGDQPSQLALAVHLGIDRTVMTYLIDDLVAEGLVERQPNPADRRQRKIVATPLGLTRLAETCTRVAAAEERVLGALDPGEQAAFREMLLRVAGSVRDVDDTTDPCAVAAATLDAPPVPGRGDRG